MGSIEKYTTKDGTAYRVRYRDPDRKSKEKAGFRRKIDAEEYLATVTVAAARGEYVDPTAGRTTVGDLGPTWLDSHVDVKPSWLSTLASAWRCYVEPRWGSTPVSKVQHSEVQQWVADLSAGRAVTIAVRPRPLSASRVIDIYGVLAGILDVAVKDRRISRNPARDIRLPRKVAKKRSYLTHTQVELLASHSGQHATLVRFLAYTGLRWGEATALRVRHLDMLKRRVSVEENAVRVDGLIVVGTPKTHEFRSVAFPAFLALELAQQSEGRERDHLVFGTGVSHLRRPVNKGGWYVRAIAKAQLEDATFPTLTVHDLRHTAASLAISSGANVKVVQKMLGHKSAAMTLDTYADLFDHDHDAVADALDKARSAAGVGDLWGIGGGEAAQVVALPRK
jgi:integrase